MPSPTATNGNPAPENQYVKFHFSPTRSRAFDTRSPALLAVVLLAACLSACSGSSGSSNTAQGEGRTPSVSLTASSTSVSSGGRVTLTWSSSRANGCSASGGWSGDRPTSGSESVGPISRDTTFTLSCSGDSGGAVQQVTVRIDQGQGAWINLTASPEYVEAGGTSTLSWNASGASGCTASGGWSGAKSAAGSFTAGPINTSTTYQLSCDGPDGSSLAMVTVQVVDKILRWQAPTQNVDGTPLNDLAGYVIYWGSSSRNYSGQQTINSPTTTQWEATIPAGQYYFAMTAFDAENNESGYSNEVVKIIP